MPHINRIRVNNIKYNFGTQGYDDFIMRLSGKNTIYDLANGGGKSILLLLLMQNMLPNCTLDDKQPIEKLFRSGNNNKVIHSLIEWKLNPCHVKNGFVYMTTGFCARKAKEDDNSEKSSTAPIEYFNYCIFYREFNSNDIVNLPLSNDEEKITYQGLRNYLRDIAKKDYSIEVHVFDGKNEYQRFISEYGIYESEWELIRGINKTEGHVRTFFETHYKTTRKVVEDLFIEEIIEKSYKTQWEGSEKGDNIARTLLDIKDKLVELSRKKGEISHFDHQADALNSFCDRLHSMRGIYREKAGYEETVVKTCRTVNERCRDLKDSFDNDCERLTEYNNKLLSIEKDVEKVKIAIEEQYLENLSEETDTLRTQNEVLKQDVKKREEHLLLCEAANSYFEYVENDNQMKIQNNAIFDINGKNGDLLNEIQALAFHLNKAYQEEKRDDEIKLEQLESELKKLREELEDSENLERDNRIALAVFQDNLDKNEQEIKKIGQELEELRQQSSLSLAEEALPALDNRRKLLEKYESQMSDLRERERSLIEIIARMEAGKIQSDERQAVIEEKRRQYKKRLDDFDASNEKINQMQQIYGATKENLLSCVEEAYQSRLVKLDRLNSQKKALDEKVALLRNPASYEDSDNTETFDDCTLNKALKYIMRHYDENAVTGYKYISTLPKEEAEQLIKNVPFIGGCIIMNKHFQEAALDTSLQERLAQNESIVLVKESALQNVAISDNNLNVSNEIAVIGSVPYTILDDKSREQLISESVEEIAKIEKEAALTKESVKVLKSDLFVIDKCFQTDITEIEQLRKDLSKANDDMNKLLEDSEEFTNEFNIKKEALAQCGEKIVEISGNNNNILQEIQLFEKIKTLLERYSDIDKVIIDNKRNIKQIKVELSEYYANINKIKEEIELRSNKWELISKRIKNHNDNISKYEQFITGEQFPDIDVDKSELEQLFCGKLVAFEEKNVDISDKKRLVYMYQTAKNKNEADIKYRGFTIEELEKLSIQGAISEMTIEQLSLEKEKLRRAKKLYDDNYNEYSHKQSQYDRQLGLVDYGKSGYENKFQEKYISDSVKQSINSMQTYVKEGNVRIKLAKAEGKALQEKLKAKERQLMSFEALASELEHLIESYEINMDAYSGLLPQETDISEACKNVRKDYQRLAKQEQKCRESFERDKAQLIETLNMLESKDLADEIQRQLSNPSNVNQIEQYIENISTTIKYIRLEKSRVGESIEHMELMKDNFVKQCLQTCISIKEALERLPKLSSIQLDEETINMVQLHIPYIDENMFPQAMDNYITEIVECVDGIETPAERLKYIKNRLAWKRLFSVLVKDMDKIKLQLYKRERMKEQSRYLKYEEAVGSTGQSQGIYIQFLVAVINYISSMNSYQGHGGILKNVIFIDNPFGAAKDVYIWEPIFEMLKSNHVQLIVPARGVTPAITGRFEVNYILGQKLVGSCQQTVIVDYRSQTEEEFLEYKELEYIQETFKF